MARVFVVNKYTLPHCIRYGLFGVPDTARAANQIHMVRAGEKLFLYEHGVKRIHGVYRALGNAFREQYPKKGPWNDREEDAKHGYYPFRIEVEPIVAYQEALTLGDVEALDIGFNEDLIRARPSVIYLPDEAARKLEMELDKRNQNVPQVRVHGEKYPSQPLPKFDLELSKGSPEEKFTFDVQVVMNTIEEGLQPVQAFYPLRATSGRNIWIDILARDSDKNFVVVELKTEDLEESIWNQVFHYAWILRSRLSRESKVRAVVICQTAEPKLEFAYQELKRHLREPEFLKVYKYYRTPTGLQFRELSPTLVPHS